MNNQSYAEIIAFGKKNNPKVFNSSARLCEKMIKLDDDLETMTHPVARIITIQLRNALAFALGEELIPEEKLTEE